MDKIHIKIYNYAKRSKNMSKRNLFILIGIFLIIFSVKIVHAQKIECHKGFVKEYYHCKNPKTSLSYRNYEQDTSTYFSLNDIWCGNDCNFDGTNCKRGLCDKKEIIKYGYTEIKDKKFYNPKTNLSFAGDDFYLNNIPCGSKCNFDGTNCKLGYCDKNELTKYGYTETKGETLFKDFYNPDNNLSFHASDNGSGDVIIRFYYNGVHCGYNCNLDGTNCKSGYCNKNELTKYGYTEIKDEKYHKELYNPKSNLSFYTDNESTDFYLNGKSCGTDCSLDGKNCKSGYCDKDKLAIHGYTAKDNNFNNSKNHLTFNYHGQFYIDGDYYTGVQCGQKCDLNGKNCKIGYCDINEIKKHGYTEKKDKTDRKDYSAVNGYYCPWGNGNFCYFMENRFYNPKTHIAFQNGWFYLDDVLCGFNCDLDGKNCEKGACVVDFCENEYKNLGILTAGNWDTTYLIPDKKYTKYVICHNNSKYYNVFEPNIKKSAILKNIKHINN